MQPADRALVEQVLAPTGQLLWVAAEEQLDAVTALSGSGPAYFFFFVEAMMAAAVDMGLSAEQGRRLALASSRRAAACSITSSGRTVRTHPSSFLINGKFELESLQVLSLQGCEKLIEIPTSMAQ